jgi:hypothetical protein
MLVSVPLVGGEHPDLRSGELAALRQALEAEVDLAAFRRVEVAESLQLRWDSRHHRQQALELLLAAEDGIDEEMVASFAKRNRKKLALWPGARRTLGERADKRAFLIADPKGLDVQFGRVGWDPEGRRGLVYLELRPRSGAEAMRAIFRVVRRTANGWSVEVARAAVDRGDYAREMAD